MKKKILLLLLCAILCLEVFPIKTIHADDNGVAQSNDNVASVTWGGTEHFYNDKDDAWSAANIHNGTIKLLKDWYTTEQLEVSGDVTLDLFDHKIDVQKRDRLIYIEGGFVSKLFGGARLTIVDSGPNKTGSLENGFRQSGAVGGSGIHVLGTLIFKGGTIRNCVNEGGYDGQGTIYIDRATFMLDNPGYVAMYDGAAISDCKAEDGGGAVYLDEYARFYMYGGTIANCSAYGSHATGGAVYAFSGSTFEMSGGTITDCYAPAKNTDYGNGGGVYAYSGSTFKMSGGTIKNCFANRGGGVYLRRGCYTIDNGVEIGSDGILSGGSIIKNRAYINGGGVFVERGKTGFGAVATATLTIKGDISVQDNHGKDKQDGPCRDDVFLDISDDTTDGFRPYLFVKGNLTNKVYVLSNQGGRFSMRTEFGDQSSHIISDDNGYVVTLHDDNRYYFDIVQADIYDAYLVTYGDDRVNATVTIDKTSKVITIQANREIDYESPFGFEKVELHWRGDHLRDLDDIDTRRIYYDSPFTTTIFWPLKDKKCYVGHYGVYDRRSEESGDAVWEVRVYGTNSGESVSLYSKNTDVYAKYGAEWQKLEPVAPYDTGFEYKVNTQIPIKIVAKEFEGKEFGIWKYRNIQNTSGDDEINPGMFVIPGGLEITYAKVWPFYIDAESKYEIKAINGYFNNDTSCKSIKVVEGTAVDVTFYNDSPDTHTFAGWSTTGTYQIPDELVKKENILFYSPAESFTIIGNKEEKHDYKLNFYKTIDGISTKIQDEEVKNPNDSIVLTAPEIENYVFIDFTVSDKSIKTEIVNNVIKFLMPRNNVDVYANYVLDTRKYVLEQENTIAPGISEHLSGEEITITRMDTPIGYQYEGFKLYTSDGKEITDSSEISKIVKEGTLTSSTIKITMPKYNLKVVSTYRAQLYELQQINTINDGTTSHIVGDRIYIQAKDILKKEFDHFEFTYKDGSSIENPESYLQIENIYHGYIGITMPDSNIIIEAKHKDIPTAYTLTQEHTVNEGKKVYPIGEHIYIKALEFDDKQFDSWKFIKVINGNETPIIGYELNKFIETNIVEKNISTDHFTLIMPNHDLIVIANYNKEIVGDKHELIQIRTTNEGTIKHYKDALIDIKALEITGSEFIEFNFYQDDTLLKDNDLVQFKTKYVRNEAEDSFTLIMPDFDTKVEAVFRVIPTMFVLEQINTTTEGVTLVEAGANVGTIVAKTIEGKTFKQFNFYKNGELIEENERTKFIADYVDGDPSTGTFSLKKMPDFNTKVEATFNDYIPPTPTLYTLKQIETIDEGEKQYEKDTNVSIKAHNYLGSEFDKWIISVNNIELNEIALSDFVNNNTIEKDISVDHFTLIMPANYVTVEAKFKKAINTFILTQINTVDDGEKDLYPGTKVTIKADTIKGKTFKEFVFSSNGTTKTKEELTQYIAGDLSTGCFTLTMPNFNLTVKADYQEDPLLLPNELTQIKTVDSGKKQYFPGSNVSIKAMAQFGSEFDAWKFYDVSGQEISHDSIKEYIDGDILSNHFTLIMPDFDLKVEATFKNDNPYINPHILEQVNTVSEGSALYFPGAKIPIQAKAGNFKEWKFYDASGKEISRENIKEYIDGDILSNHFTLVMPNHNLVVVALFDDEPIVKQYKLTQIKTIDEGMSIHYENDYVYIEALNVSQDAFIKFKYSDANGEIKDAALAAFKSKYIEQEKDNNIILKMPNYDLTIEAIFSDVKTPHKLICVNTINEGTTYHYGGEPLIVIEALTFLGGINDGFDFYKIIDGEEIKTSVYYTEDSTNPKQKITLTVMPDFDLKVVAKFKAENEYKLTASFTDEGIGRVVTLHKNGDSITLKPATLLGSTFKKWEAYKTGYEEVRFDAVDGNTNSKITFNMPAYDLTVRAIFTDTTPYYSTEVIHGDVNGESISISREGIHLVVKASVNLGASFKTWKAYKYVPDVTTGAKSSANTMYKKVELTEAERIEYGIPSLTNSTLKFDQPNADLEFEATYEIDKCRLTVINGTISDGSTSKTFDLGDTVYINANTSNGYHFSHWEVVEGNPIWPADGKTYKYTHVILRGDATVRAVFEEYKIPPTSVK